MKIVLCGFMGCGKSTIGRTIAKNVKYKFLDIDKYIEKKHDMTISDIFENHGEDFFRNEESESLREILNNDNIIIGSGGGTVINPKNVEIIKECGGTIVFLDVPVTALQERLKRDKRRPLLQRDDRREFIKELHSKRYSLYKNASDIIVDAGAPINVVAKRVCEYIK